MSDEDHTRQDSNRRLNSSPIVTPRVAPKQIFEGYSYNGAQEACACGGGDFAPSSFVYALGTVDLEIPDPSIDEELHFFAKKVNIKPKHDLRSWAYDILRQPNSRYIARQLRWLLKVEGFAAYHLVLRDLNDLTDLIECLSLPEDDLCLVIGASSLAPVEMRPGISAPILSVEHLSSFKKVDIKKWFGASPTNQHGASKTTHIFDPEELYNRLLHSCDDYGATGKSRALNFLAVRYKPLHEKIGEMAVNGYRLKYFDVEESRLTYSKLTGSNGKDIVDVVFTFSNDYGAEDRHFVRVDLSYLFPVLVSHLAEYTKRF